MEITKNLKNEIFLMCYDLLSTENLTETERLSKAAENMQNLINLGIQTGEIK